MISKIKMKKEFTDFYFQKAPEMFETITVEKRISLSNKFIKNNMYPDSVLKKIIEEIGASYLGYFDILKRTLSETNLVDFNYLKSFGLSSAMLDQQIKPKLKKLGIVKKVGGNYYANPLFVSRTQILSEDLLKMFEKENLEIYGIKLK